MSDQHLARKKKLCDLRESGHHIYDIHKLPTHTKISELLDRFGSSTNLELEQQQQDFYVFGRVLFIRGPFLKIRNNTSLIQIYVGKDEYTNKYVDIGDIVSVRGHLFLTKVGEITIKSNNLQIISKCLHPLPEKHIGFKNPELKLRKRIIDCMVDISIMQKFERRSFVMSVIRDYFVSSGYLEVETPILQPIYGGALAQPFITYHNSLKEKFFLRIAPEIYLKKMIISGFNKIFEIGRSFRNEGIDSTHNPEFTSLEAYTTLIDLEECMNFSETLFHTIAKKLNITTLEWQEHTIHISKPFNRVSLIELVKQKTGHDFTKKIELETLLSFAKQHNITLLEHEKNEGHICHKIFEELIEHELIHPTFVFDYHTSVSPLSKKDPNNPHFTQRFELFIGGKEFANAFAELSDPEEQLKNFEMQFNDRRSEEGLSCEIDMSYIEALEYGLPPTTGLGIGIDRLIMLFTQSNSIKDIIFFPQLRN